MKYKIYQIDAFTHQLFGGNPAAVVPLPNWLPTPLLQQIAFENNLAETAFYLRDGDQFEIRWFTPTVEVDLCGHATMAAAYVLFFIEGYEGHEICFYSRRSGKLIVRQEDELLTLNFPTDTYQGVLLTKELTSGFNYFPQRAFKGKTDYMLEFAFEWQVKNLEVNPIQISKLGGRGVIVTAKGDNVDFVSRFFAPQSGIHEDPVTGSAHTTLIPYWAMKLGKNELTAIQLSERKGYLQCKYLGERVEISGMARLYMKGEIFIEEQKILSA